jgi:hypothetical protein
MENLAGVWRNKCQTNHQTQKMNALHAQVYGEAGDREIPAELKKPKTPGKLSYACYFT